MFIKFSVSSLKGIGMLTRNDDQGTLSANVFINNYFSFKKI